jgi:hypothetical protein
MTDLATQDTARLSRYPTRRPSAPSGHGPHLRPSGSGRLEAAQGRHTRLIADSVPSDLAASHYLDSVTGSFVHADLKRE